MQHSRAFALLVFLLSITVFIPLARADASVYFEPESFVQDLNAEPVTIDFEGIASAGGQANAVQLAGDEFSGVTFISEASPAGGIATVGIPDASISGGNNANFFAGDMVPTSGSAVLVALRVNDNPGGNVIVDFDEPTNGVGATFLDIEASISSIEVFDGTGATGKSLGFVSLTQQGDDSQAFAGVIVNGIRSARLVIGDGGDGVGLDDLIFTRTDSRTNNPPLTFFQQAVIVQILSRNYSGIEFTWPIDPMNKTNGHDGPCVGDWQDGRLDGCFWLSPVGQRENAWRDVQPHQRHLNTDFNKYHLGADYNLGSGSSDEGLPVYPAADGVIPDGGVLENVCTWGNIVFVQHETDLGVVTTMYAHVDWLDTGPPKPGIVTSNHPIAKIGNGAWNCENFAGSWPYHLHFEVRIGTSIEPGEGYTEEQLQHGEKGAQGQIDPNKFIRRF